MERPAEEGDSPVGEIGGEGKRNPEYHEARETLWETGETTLQG